MTWLIVIIAIAVVVAGFAANSRRKELLNSGQIINRSSDFVEYAHIFTLKDMTFDEIREALMSADYFQRANPVYNNEKEAMGFKGAGWNAQMYHMPDTTRNAYCFQYTHWDTYRGTPMEANAMNTVLTTVEKTLLKLDPNTQVSTKKFPINSTPRLF